MRLPKDLGSAIKVVSGNVAKAFGSEAVNGAAIDRSGFLSAVLATNTGAATGSPTAQTMDAKLQESADGSTGWSDISGAAITQITADNGHAEKNVDLSGAKKYIRVVQTCALTAGTSPGWPAASEVVLGGSDSEPV